MAGIATRLDKIVPSAQDAAANRQTTTPATDTEPPADPDKLCPNNSATPASPTSSPSTGAKPRRTRFSPASKPSSHSGTVAISSDASPDGTVRSAYDSAAFAPSISRPTIAHPSHCARLGLPPLITTGNMIAPAIRKRPPAISGGGSVSTATRIARYVLPQTTQTMSSAAHPLPRRTLSLGRTSWRSSRPAPAITPTVATFPRAARADERQCGRLWPNHRQLW